MLGQTNTATRTQLNSTLRGGPLLALLKAARIWALPQLPAEVSFIEATTASPTGSARCPVPQLPAELSFIEAAARAPASRFGISPQLPAELSFIEAG